MSLSRATASFIPTIFGIVTLSLSGPLLKISFTDEPDFTLEPTTGSVPHTSPLSTVSLYSSDVDETESPKASSFFVASSFVNFVSSGIVTPLLPLLYLMVTREYSSTLLPASGLCSKTVFGVSSDSTGSSLHLSFFSSSISCASSSVLPLILGTSTMPALGSSVASAVVSAGASVVIEVTSLSSFPEPLPHQPLTFPIIKRITIRIITATTTLHIFNIFSSLGSIASSSPISSSCGSMFSS